MTTPELNKALCKCQIDMGAAVKDSLNPHFKSKYADITSIIDAIRLPMGNNGLSITQTTRLEGSLVVLVTTLRHISGEMILSEYPVIPVKNDPQGYGSALTYARRYSIQSMLMVPTDDDDGHLASQPTKSNTQTQQLAQPTLKERIVKALNDGKDPKVIYLKLMADYNNEIPRDVKGLLQGIEELKGMDGLI